MKDLKKIELESYVRRFQKNLINSKKKIDDIMDAYPLTPNFQACFKLMVEKRFEEIVKAKV